jgi:tRNA 2-selenouridine synthase SelU
VGCYHFELQQQNSKGIKEGTKRERKTGAKPLPEGITQNMMNKYVVYYEDYADKEKKRLRQYFKIEKHPKLDKIFIGSKSNIVSIQEKLKQINKIVVVRGVVL